jgi:hypothetical protein
MAMNKASKRFLAPLWSASAPSTGAEMAIVAIDRVVMRLNRAVASAGASSAAA